MSSGTLPRKDGKTQAEADADYERDFMSYYTQDEERALPDSTALIGAGQKMNATKPKTKQPARKQAVKAANDTAKPTKMTNNEETQSSPLTRKSARVAGKRKASESSVSDQDEVESQQLQRKPEAAVTDHTTAISADTTTVSAKALGKRKATDASLPDSDEDDEQASKRTKLPANKSGTTTPEKAAANSAKKRTQNSTPTTTAQKTIKHVAKASGDVSSTNDGDEGEQSDDEAEAGQGKGKKSTVKAFQGTKSGFGTSMEKPEDAPNDEPWKCANRDCNSGQTYHPRDGPNSYGRKVISNFFGRNKKETNLIHADVWHNCCRKCYQRGTYRVNTISNHEKINYYLENIEMQLDRIELWRPEATFEVRLTKSAHDRLNRYYKERAKLGATDDSAKAAVTKAKETNAKGKPKPLTLEEGFPVDLIKDFDEYRSQKSATFGDIKRILNWIKHLSLNGQIDSMPPMEFLIDKETEDEEVIDPSTNYERWCAYEDGVAFGDGDGDAEDAIGEANDTQGGDEITGLEKIESKSSLFIDSKAAKSERVTGEGHETDDAEDYDDDEEEYEEKRSHTSDPNVDAAVHLLGLGAYNLPPGAVGSKFGKLNNAADALLKHISSEDNEGGFKDLKTPSTPARSRQQTPKSEHQASSSSAGTFPSSGFTKSTGSPRDDHNDETNVSSFLESSYSLKRKRSIDENYDIQENEDDANEDHVDSPSKKQKL